MRSSAPRAAGSPRAPRSSRASGIATAGRVLVGGVDVRDVDPNELMDHVAFVFQTNKLFRRTLADNVRAAASRRHGRRSAGRPRRRPVRRHRGQAAAGNRHHARPRRGVSIGRGGSARGACPRDSQGRAHRRARRGDGLRRPRERGAHPACFHTPGQGAHGCHDRPQALDRRGRGPDRGPRPGPRRRERHARGASCPKADFTQRCGPTTSGRQTGRFPQRLPMPPRTPSQRREARLRCSPH